MNVGDGYGADRVGRLNQELQAAPCWKEKHSWSHLSGTNILSPV